MLIGLGICAVLIYLKVAYTSGTETCTHCGVEREAYHPGPFWFHSAISDHDREGRGWARIAVCSKHSWVRSGCWSMFMGVECYVPVLPPEG